LGLAFLIRLGFFDEIEISLGFYFVWLAFLIRLGFFDEIEISLGLAWD